jgi:predicted phosphohydrolase
MTIWAIADIHASPLDESGRPTKPMNIFGDHWDGHVEAIERAWTAKVDPQDTVLIAGDIDWSLRLEDANSTLTRIDSWPGRKIIARGNHDYWWSSGASAKVRAALPPSLSLIHNDALEAEGFNIVGCKGSPVPGSYDWSEVDAKLLNRETERLKLSLARRDPSRPSIAVIHYPPWFESNGPTPYTQLFKESNVVLCVYGHLHAEAARSGVSGMRDGVEYRLVAADHVGFQPIPVAHDGRVLPV